MQTHLGTGLIMITYFHWYSHFESNSNQLHDSQFDSSRAVCDCGARTSRDRHRQRFPFLRDLSKFHLLLSLAMISSTDTLSSFFRSEEYSYYVSTGKRK